MRAICKKMSMDIKGLCSMIDEYRYRHNRENPSYLIMNYLSIASIRDQTINKNNIGIIIKSNLGNETLFGIPVALNEGLKFGEVDII